MPQNQSNQELKKLISDLVARGFITKLNNKYILTEKGYRAMSELEIKKIQRILKTNN